MDASTLVLLSLALLVAVGAPSEGHADPPSMRGKIQRLRTEAALMGRAERAGERKTRRHGAESFVRGVGRPPENANANGVVTLNGPVMGRVEVIAIHDGDQVTGSR